MTDNLNRRAKAKILARNASVPHASKVLSSVGETVYEWDIAKDTLNWADNAPGLLGIENPAEIASGREYTRLVAPHSSTNRNEAVLGSETKDTGDGVYYQIQYALAAGALNSESDVWIEDSGRWFADKNGQPARAHGIVRIINERRSLEERFDRLSRFDDLTSLYNRGYMNECLEVELREAEIGNSSLAFLLVALDRFEHINSIYGYDAGDEVIAETANRMRKSLRSHDIIGRFSGAKLGVILKSCNERELLFAGQRFLDNISKEVVQTEKGPVAVTASIGGVILPRRAKNIRQVNAAVQSALEQARRQRHPRLVVYSPDPEAKKQREIATRLAGDVVSAVQENRLKLAWQPVVDANSHKVAYHEALVRMVDRDNKIVPASGFVDVAIDLGLIRMVDHQALNLTLDTLINVPRAKIAVNVSMETFHDPSWLSNLVNSVRQQPDIASRLIIEITESHAIDDLDEAARFIEIIRDLGCKTAIDDFGAGFTSFSNLKHLPVDIIKIDGQFVENLATNHENQCFIRSLIQLAGVFDTKIVVEWVDDDQTALMLKEWGVDYLQGYGFGAPVMTAPWPMEAPISQDNASLTA